MNKLFLRYGVFAIFLTYSAVFISVNYNSNLIKNYNRTSASTIHINNSYDNPVLVADGAFFTPSLSSDNSKLLFSTGDNIYEMNLDSKITKQLTSLGNCYNPVYFEKDNNIVAFARNNGIYILDKKNNAIKRIVSSDSSETSFAKPSFTPEGDIVYFTVTVLPKSDGHGFTEKDAFIYKVSKDGKTSVKLVQGYNPVISPDGKKLLYELKDNLYVMDTQTKEIKKVGSGKYGSWSNSGRWLSFAVSNKEVTAYTKHKWIKKLFIDREYSNIYTLELLNNGSKKKITSEEFDDRNAEIQNWADDVKHTNIEQHFLLASKKAYFDSAWSKDDKELYVSMYNSEKGGFELVKYKLEK